MINLSLLEAAPEGLGLSSFLTIGVTMIALYLLMFRPQQKRQKEDAKMRAAIEVGDDVVTIGGIVGIVISIKDDTLVLETGSDRSKIRVMRWAIQQNATQKEAAAPAKTGKK